MFVYAGIGSRETPSDILKVMENLAYEFSTDSILRSGGAPGADTAFQFGAQLGGGRTEIYLPWNGFNGQTNNGYLMEPTEAAMELAAHYHPGWKHLKHGAKKLIARNGHQILGKNLDDPVEMVICWTANGSHTGRESGTGGTGQALRIACDYQIEVLNLYHPEDLARVKEAIGNGGLPLC